MQVQPEFGERFSSWRSMKRRVRIALAIRPYQGAHFYSSSPLSELPGYECLGTFYEAAEKTTDRPA